MSLIGTFFKRVPVICGFLEKDSFCYSLDMRDQYWRTNNFTLLEQRAQAAGVSLENGSWIIFGGQKYNEQLPILLNTSEILIDANFNFGPDLPLPLSGHCIVKIDQNHIFSAGGYGQQFLKEAFIMQTLNGSWETISPMFDGRYGHICGKVLSSFNHIQIVAAGGLRINKVEIYLHQKQYWIYGPEMIQRNFFKAATVQGPTSFLMVGGLELEPCSTSDCQLKEIYIFDRLNNAWKHSQQNLKIGRGNHIAIGLPPNVECTSKFLYFFHAGILYLNISLL